MHNEKDESVADISTPCGEEETLYTKERHILAPHSQTKLEHNKHRSSFLMNWTHRSVQEVDSGVKLSSRLLPYLEAG